MFSDVFHGGLLVSRIFNGLMSESGEFTYWVGFDIFLLTTLSSPNTRIRARTKSHGYNDLCFLSFGVPKLAFILYGRLASTIEDGYGLYLRRRAIDYGYFRIMVV